MKLISKIYSTLFAAALVAISNSSYSQNSLGAGLTVHPNGGDNDIGLDVRARFGMGDALATSFDINALPSYRWSGASLGINANLQYILGDKDAFSFCPLAGMHIATSTNFNYGRFGLNLGGCGNYMLNEKLAIFGEIKLKVRRSSSNRSVLNFGLMFSL
jgi:hypothetical protein